jgi:two-component system LytT family sensor kinase
VAEQCCVCARMLFMARDNRLRLPSYWQFQMMGWACMYVLGFVGSIPDILKRPGALRAHTVTIVIMFLASCALHPFCRSALRRSPSWPAFAVRAAGWCMVWAIVSSLATQFALFGFHNINWPSLVGISVQFAFVLFLWCSLYLSIKKWQQSAEERERLLRAETEVREARLSALRYQLNPHFLFNSLNAVSTLVLDGNAPAATRMLAQIGELLRTSLDNEVMPQVALSQEMAFTKQYLAIEQTRLGERLQVELTIPSETLDALVPSMLLQPLVENAVRHGIAKLIEGGKITIESGLHEGRLRIVIRNSGRRGAEKQNEPGNGIGLSNTTERLKTLYGTDHKVLLEWPQAGGCEVTVELPFRRAERPQEALPCAR